MLSWCKAFRHNRNSIIPLGIKEEMHKYDIQYNEAAQKIEISKKYWPRLWAYAFFTNNSRSRMPGSLMPDWFAMYCNCLSFPPARPALGLNLLIVSANLANTFGFQISRTMWTTSACARVAWLWCRLASPFSSHLRWIYTSQCRHYKYRWYDSLDTIWYCVTCSSRSCVAW